MIPEVGGKDEMDGWRDLFQIQQFTTIAVQSNFPI